MNSSPRRPMPWMKSLRHRLAMVGLAVSPRLTDAALHGEFSDSAHFSRMFRQTFGMTPSSVIKPLKTVTLLA